jgi:tungstate transport system ATP-binding protein
VTSMMPLVVEKARVRRRGKVLVGPVSFTLEATGVTIVMGPNGSGKTSLLRMLHGVVRLADGKVSWSCGDREARSKQAFVFQTPVMLRRSVKDNLAFPLRVQGTAGKQAAVEAECWADKIGLTHALAQSAGVLSGGEQQKLALARALISNPEVLFLDEPCASLDGSATREIETLLHNASQSGTRIIMATHDMGQARRLATEVLFILQGKLHEFSSAEVFFQAAKTDAARAFLNGDIIE